MVHFLLPCNYETIFGVYIYDHLATSVSIAQLTVLNSSSNLTLTINVDPENLKNLPTQVKSLSDDFTKVKIKHNSMYGMLRMLKYIDSFK